MKTTNYYFSRVLCALMLCAGLLVTSCTEGPLEQNEDTEQGGSENQGGGGNEDGGGEKPGQGGENQGGQGEPAEGEGDVVQTEVVTMTLGEVTATTATFTGHLDVPASDLSFSQITVYYSDSEPFNVNTARRVSTTTFDEQQNFTITLQGLKSDTKYNYSLVAEVKSEKDYSDVAEFTTDDVVPAVSVVESSITATTASFSGTVTSLSDVDKSLIQVGMAYSSVSGDLQSDKSTKVASGEISEEGTYSMSIDELAYDTKYYFCSYVKQNGIYKYGEVKELTTVNVVPAVSVVESSITATTASFIGLVSGLSDVDKSLIQVGMAYSSASGDLQSYKSTKVASGEISEEGTYSMSIDELAYDTKYYFCSYVKQNGIYKYGEVKEFVTIGITLSIPSDATDLSASSTANCYIVSRSGKYCFKIYKGNSSDFIGRGEDVPQGYPSSAAVLWETFGTSTTPSVGDLVRNVTYKDGYITFEASDKKGNAVIAAKDASGKILWSWHIWLTVQPQGQVYYNNAGTMMDRNLGATSAIPGDVRALGLLYQWGRKDPFLNSSQIDGKDYTANSTLSWPSAVKSYSKTGTIDYVTSNPTTFVTCNSNNYDWYYSDVKYETDNTRWQSEKTIYDPCPPGWRVPDGGSDGVWSKALGSSSSFGYTYNSTNKGMNFSGKFGSASTIWYPASGYRDDEDGWLYGVGGVGIYWSVSPGGGAYSLCFGHNDSVFPLDGSRFGSVCGNAVRCLQE